ncbi:hypothetical protein [Saccharothrix texasensis]|nr:hypothetical protein [Saccharothrix texasensis]
MIVSLLYKVPRKLLSVPAVLLRGEAANRMVPSNVEALIADLFG